MKTTAKIFILFLVVNFFILVVPQKVMAQVSINFQLFYDNLSPHGYWVDNPEYGYVWVPNVSDAFIPYGTNGHWVFTNVGWTWISNYSWGWAPFHYGRWFYDPYSGWIWVPGYQWGPGWVTWRASDDYYGWTPIGPDISFTIANSSGYRLPYNQWIFVRNRDFGRTNIYNYHIPSSRNVTIINNSTVINNVYRDNSTRVRYNAGPNRTDVERRTGTKISPVTLKQRNRPGQTLSNRELGIYRPQIRKNRTAERAPAPSKVTRFKDVKPTTLKNISTQRQKEIQSAKQQQLQRKVRNDQQFKEQQIRQQRNNQQVKEQQVRQQRIDQQTKEQKVRQQMERQTTEQQSRQQRNNQQAKEEQQVRRQQIERQAKEQRVLQQRNNQQAREQQNKQYQNDMKAKQKQN